MRIAFSINGEGRGHFSRAVALAEILIARHEISFWAPEHLTGELKERFPACTVQSIPYFAFVQNGFTVDYVKTALANSGLLFGAMGTSAEIAKRMKALHVDAVVSDFEPFAARAAKLLGIPVLQLNHPGVVLRSFRFSLRAFIAQIVSRYMMARSDRTIICSFFDGDVGPIVRKELRERKPERGDHVVVYMKPLYRDTLMPLLESLGGDRFRTFPNKQADYAETLLSCRALVAPAGHQSISEALALGKPVLAIPVEGQYEQELNARKLRSTGFGDWCRHVELKRKLPEFLYNLAGFEAAIARARETGPQSVHSGQKGASCRDETERAALLVEKFCLESRRRPEWRRKPLLAAVLLNELP